MSSRQLNMGQNKPNPQQGANSLRNRNRALRVRGGGTSTFQGASAKMKGNVFQTYAEQQKKGQFTTTMEELQIYVAENLSNDAEYFKPMFRDLIRPSIPKQSKHDIVSDKVTQKTVETTDSQGNVIESIEIVDTRTQDEKDIDDMIFMEQVKNWVKDSKRLRSSERALYEVVWGQCSKLLQVSLAADKDYKRMDLDGDVTSLLKTHPQDKQPD